MKLMLEIAYNFLKNEKQATLKQIFAEVKSEKKVEWKERFPRKLLSEIEIDKMGELYTYLSTDGRFLKIDDKNWSLIENYSFEEVKKLKINIKETKE